METQDADAIENWQQSVKSNILYVRLVLWAFIAMCFAIGFVIDMAIQMFYFGSRWWPAFKSFLLFQQIAYASYIVTVLGIILLVVFYYLQKKIMLIGLDYKSLTAATERNTQQQALYDGLLKMSESMGLNKMPDLLIVNSPIINAFVSGSKQKKSFMVLTEGLIENLSPDELQAVIAMQLCYIKRADQQLTLAVALVANVAIIFFDLIYHRFLYAKDRDREPNPLVALIFRGLKIGRFLLPMGTFLFRFILSPERVYQAEKMTVKMMNTNAPLARALIKMHEQQFSQSDKFGEYYSELACDEIRRESYLFDPADINKAQTFATPFTTQPSLEEQLHMIAYDYRPKYSDSQEIS